MRSWRRRAGHTPQTGTALLALALAAAPAAAGDPDANGPVGVVERLHGELLDVMKHARELGYDGRARSLSPVLGDVYDLPLMARRSVGSQNWKTLSGADQTRFVDTFGRLTVANYAGRFDGYQGERFETLAQEPSLQDTVLVRTQIVKSDGEVVRLDYRLHEADGRWRIVDVYMNGTISEIAMRRSEYSALLRREGLAALLKALEQKISDLQSGRS